MPVTNLIGDPDPYLNVKYLDVGLVQLHDDNI